jgi:hypothetical protein
MSSVSANPRWRLDKVLEILAENISDNDVPLFVTCSHPGGPDLMEYQEMAQRPETMQIVKDSMSETMRTLVDCWILSGKNTSGTDRPLDRKVNWTSPAFPVPLERAFCALITWPGEGPIEEMQPDGKRRLVHYFPRLDNAISTMHGVGLGWSYALREHGKRLAMFYFAELLDSPYSYHIARCDGCKGYFAYERKPRRSISRGTFCKSCPSSASKLRTQAYRDGEREELRALAVKFWPQWTERKHPNRAFWIAQQMNAKRKATERRITQKWVSRNIDIRTGKVKEDAKG